MTEPRLYDTAKPADLAMLAVGEYYWCDCWRGSLGPAIVFIRRGPRGRGRIVSDGCEYTEWNLREWVDQCLQWDDPLPRFFGPLSPPAEMQRH